LAQTDMINFFIESYQ